MCQWLCTFSLRGQNRIRQTFCVAENPVWGGSTVDERPARSHHSLSFSVTSICASARCLKSLTVFFFLCGQNIFFLAAANGDSKLVGTVVTLHKIKKVRLLSFFRIQIKLFRFYHSVGSHFWKTGHVNNVQPSLQKGIDRREMNRPRVIHGCETTIDKEFGASNLYLGRPMCSSDCSNGDINRSLVSERPGISTIWRRLCREQQKKKFRNEDIRHAWKGWKCCSSKRYAWFLLTAKMQFRRESWKVYAKAESGELILSECASSNEPHNKLNHDALLQYGSGEKGRRSWSNERMNQQDKQMGKK